MIFKAVHEELQPARHFNLNMDPGRRCLEVEDEHEADVAHGEEDLIL